MARANRVAIATTEVGFKATFYKTHDKVAFAYSDLEGWQPTTKTQNAQREEFRIWVQENASKFGVEWKPELQTQAWERKFWKYESDSQVEEDAIELMGWTIRDICAKCKYQAQIGEVRLDSIVANKSNLSYVEDGKYTKNGNWASATVNLEVEMSINGTAIDIVYPIEW